MPEDIVLRWALLAAAVLAVITLLAMLQVLALSNRGRRLELRRTELESRWRPWIARAGAGMETEPPPGLPAGRESLWLMLMFTRTLQALRGSGRERVQELGRQIGLHARAVATLRSRRINHVLVALACLRELADARDWVDVQLKAGHHNLAVAMAAARVMVALDAPRAMEKLLPRLLAGREWSSGQMHELCSRAGAAALTPALETVLANGSQPEVERAMTLVPLADPLVLAPWARAILDRRREGLSTDAPEATEQALDVLKRLADPRDRQLLLPLLSSDSTGIRLRALSALSRQSLPADADCFETALTDRDWAVRQAAADALVRLPGGDSTRLVSMCEGLADQFARDALRRALAERSS